ncbi:hypothetical protein [Streptomyces sp. NPDC047070]|uniref:hypothetical protein n=1 Tax=Streptomyces sp. NPDC047070 TaxID=3154923 RepID=UPI00345493F4
MDIPPVGPGRAPEKWLLRVGLVGLFIATPGVAVGYFEGFDDGTEAGAFAWFTMFIGGLLVGAAAYGGLLLSLNPQSRKERRRRTVVLRSLQAPLATADLTYSTLLEAATSSAGDAPRQKPPAPVTDDRGRLVWWRDRALLSAFRLPGIAGWTVFVALTGLSGVLHLFGGTGRGLLFLAASACGLVVSVFGARRARALARVAVSEDVRPMRWLLLHEPHDGEAYLLLYEADGDPDETAPLLLQIATKRQARRLAPAGVADVHGLLRPGAVLVPWIDGAPLWTSHRVTTLDLTSEDDRGLLTYLMGPVPRDARA